MKQKKLLVALAVPLLFISCDKNEVSNSESSTDRFLAGTSWSHSFDTVLTVNDNQWDETIVSTLEFRDDGVHSYLTVTTMITHPFNESNAQNTPFDYTFDSTRNEGRMFSKVGEIEIPFVYNPVDTTIGLSLPLEENIFRFVEMHYVAGWQ